MNLNNLHSQYCARRLERLRHVLKFTHGKSKFVPRVLDAATARKDVRYLHIMLFQAERVCFVHRV